MNQFVILGASMDESKTLNSSSRLLTLSALLLGVPLLQELVRREIAKRLMGADHVVGFLPLSQFAIQRRHLQRASRDLIKLLRVRALGTFDDAIQLSVAASQSHIASPSAVEIYPSQTNQSLPAQLLPRTRQLAGSGQLLFSNVHPDTLTECQQSF